MVELELYFSYLVKKFVHFHETVPQRETVSVSDKLAVFFRPVTSTACSFEVADRLGRQPEIDTPNARKIAPSRVICYFSEPTGFSLLISSHLLILTLSGISYAKCWI